MKIVEIREGITVLCLHPDHFKKIGKIVGPVAVNPFGHHFAGVSFGKFPAWIAPKYLISLEETKEKISTSLGEMLEGIELRSLSTR